MSLKTYTLSVSLAAIIGLLVSIVPLLRSALEYRSREIAPRLELASLEDFVAAKSKDKDEVSFMLTDHSRWYDSFGRQWESMYVAAREQHVQAVRSKALRDLSAYGALCVLCIGLLITHLLWARRLGREDAR